MHELGITRNLVALVAERAAGRRVQRVWLEIGTHTALLPDAVHFCFDVVAQGTALEGARLEIIELRPGLNCRRCNTFPEIPAGQDTGGEPAVCAACGEALRRCSGDEINVKAMELAAHSPSEAPSDAPSTSQSPSPSEVPSCV